MKFNNTPEHTAARMVTNYGHAEAYALALAKAGDSRNGRPYQPRDKRAARFWLKVARALKR